MQALGREEDRPQSARPVKTPLILENDGDLMIAPSLASVAGVVEPFHVEDGDWTSAYAADGERLTYDFEHQPYKGRLGTRERWVVTLRPTGEDASTELRAKLMRLLQRLGHDRADDSTVALPDLVGRLRAVVGDL